MKPLFLFLALVLVAPAPASAGAETDETSALELAGIDVNIVTPEGSEQLPQDWVLEAFQAQPAIPDRHGLTVRVRPTGVLFATRDKRGSFAAIWHHIGEGIHHLALCEATETEDPESGPRWHVARYLPFAQRVRTRDGWNVKIEIRSLRSQLNGLPVWQARLVGETLTRMIQQAGSMRSALVDVDLILRRPPTGRWSLWGWHLLGRETAKMRLKAAFGEFRTHPDAPFSISVSLISQVLFPQSGPAADRETPRVRLRKRYLDLRPGVGGSRVELIAELSSRSKICVARKAASCDTNEIDVWNEILQQLAF